jgi:hypothetical protein
MSRHPSAVFAAPFGVASGGIHYDPVSHTVHYQSPRKHAVRDTDVLSADAIDFIAWLSAKQCPWVPSTSPTPAGTRPSPAVAGSAHLRRAQPTGAQEAFTFWKASGIHHACTHRSPRQDELGTADLENVRLRSAGVPLMLHHCEPGTAKTAVGERGI